MNKPYQQGDLDGLCGIYATINAAKLISNIINTEEWQEIFLKILKLQIKQRKSVLFMVHGLNDSKVGKILQRIISHNLHIKYKRPFKRRKKVGISEYWDHLYEFLNGQDQRSAIIWYETRNQCHWTAVADITLNRLYLFDSIGRKTINRKLCSTTKISKETPILIDFSATFYLEGIAKTKQQINLKEQLNEII